MLCESNIRGNFDTILVRFVPREALSMRDVWLDFFKERKDIVLHLRSGDSLQYRDGYLLNNQGINIIALSTSGKDKLKAWIDKGYEVTSARVSYTLAWKPQDSETEYAVCLSNIVLSRIEEKNNEIWL